MSSPLPTPPIFSPKTLTSQNTSLTEKLFDQHFFPPAFVLKLYMCVNTDSGSLAQLPVCKSVRIGLTSYSTSRCLSSLLPFGSGSGSVDLKNRCRDSGPAVWAGPQKLLHSSAGRFAFLPAVSLCARCRRWKGRDYFTYMFYDWILLLLWLASQALESLRCFIRLVPDSSGAAVWGDSEQLWRLESE